MEERQSPHVRSLVVIIVLCSILFASLKIISYGFLPTDDALRHSAKVVSGKSWQDIILLRPEITTDRHEGWHVILTGVYRATGCTKEGLVVFSVVFLALLFLLAPMPWLARPEVWPAAVVFTAIAASPPIMGRLFIGRPFILTMAVLLTLALLWRRLKSDRFPVGPLALLLVGVTLSTWTNGIPHLYVLVLLAFVLAREWLVAARLTVVVALGSILGASLTGHPLRFIWEGLVLSYRAFSDAPLQHMLVTEFQSYAGEGSFVVAIVLVLLWRRVRGEWDGEQLLRDPIFLLMGLGWLLGFSVFRFWSDWGMVAALAWLTQEFDHVAERHLQASANRGVIIALLGGVSLYVMLSSDIGGRWTRSLTAQHLSEADPVQRDWLPDPGGIVYSSVTQVFYDTFYTNPSGKWRYAMAFEPTLMPEEDLKILRRIQWNSSAFPAFSPWVAKMKPADRLILLHGGGVPGIHGLEWASPARGVWVGRLPRARGVPGGTSPVLSKTPVQ